MTKTAVNYLPQVKEQYEEFPYPERHPEDEKDRLTYSYLGRMDTVSHHIYGGKQNFENFRILIAGGGTGDTTIWWAEQLRDKKGAHITYLDLSAASMAVTQKRAEIRKLDNITWINTSLLNISDLNLGEFDLVESSGVLHHLADPDAGLRALASALKPDGVMHLMVYAPYARAGVYQMQTLMKMINTDEPSERQKITNAKEVLNVLPSHNVYKLLNEKAFNFGDTRYDAGIYDLFLHSQDRAYSMLELHDWLERCGLRLQGEPGSRNMQFDYLPENYLPEGPLLDKIREMPLKIRQAIGEGISGRIAKHEFFAMRADAKDKAAKCTDLSLIPYCGMSCDFTPQQVAEACRQRNDQFYVEVTGDPTTRVYIPAVKHRAAILAVIDGKKSVGEIVDGIDGDREEILKDFDTLLTWLGRGHMIYLRHPSVEAFPSPLRLQQRFIDIHNKSE